MPSDIQNGQNGQNGHCPKKARVSSTVTNLLEKLRVKDGHKKEFMQCAEEILMSLEFLLEKDPSLIPVIERMLEPERCISFRVAWVDDSGKQHINRGYRIQFNSAIGPYKGGLRFHPSVNDSILGFLALEQILKNSLTGLPMGGGKGGSDFDPKGKSDNEVMRFCQAFMSELHKHIGPNIDVPAGDIGVGGREIGYMFGMYKKLTNSFEGVLTGKSMSWGGSFLRPEATGYGSVFFAAEAIKNLKNSDLNGKRCLISGSGNVSLHTAIQLLNHGAIVLTMSDSSGYIHEPNGFTREQVERMMHIKEVTRERIVTYLEYSKTAKYVAGAKPWGQVDCDYVFPSATQNEIDASDALALVKTGCMGVFEGANMPSTNEAIEVFRENSVIFGPSKACNAGGVAVSGLEMSQNSLRLNWTPKEVEDKLRTIMKDIFHKCNSTAKEFGRPGDLQFGANVAGFLKVAGAMKDQGTL